MVQRSDLIAAVPPVARRRRSTTLSASEPLEARQATERALVNEGRAAIEADIAVCAPGWPRRKVEYRAETARQLLDVAPFPQPGSAAAELSCC